MAGGVCLVAGLLSVALGPSVTLAWTHSVERTEWQEDWVASPGGVRMTAARVQGSGAGMDPPPGAERVPGGWSWVPELPVQRHVWLRRSGATADWMVCNAEGCRALGDLVGDADPVRLTVCGE